MHLNIRFKKKPRVTEVRAATFTFSDSSRLLEACSLPKDPYIGFLGRKFTCSNLPYPRNARLADVTLPTALEYLKRSPNNARATSSVDRETDIIL